MTNNIKKGAIVTEKKIEAKGPAIKGYLSPEVFTNAMIEQAKVEAKANASKKAPKPPTPASFKPGWKGGPGRPVGCRNQVTVEFERIGAERSQEMYDVYMEMALVERNERALEFFLNKLWPNRKGLRKDIELGSRKVKTLSELDDISARILELMITGEISADEAGKCGEVIVQRANSITEAAIERKIVATCEKIDQIKG